MNRGVSSWLILAVPFVVILALVLPNQEAVAIGWNVYWIEAASLEPLERLKAFYWAVGGALEARREIGRRHLALTEWGRVPSAYSHIYDSLLEKRYGIHVRKPAARTLESGAYWFAHDQLMKREISRRFGRLALETAQADANKEYQLIALVPVDCGFATDAESGERVGDCATKQLAARHDFYCSYKSFSRGFESAAYAFRSGTLSMGPAPRELSPIAETPVRLSLGMIAPKGSAVVRSANDLLLDVTLDKDGRVVSTNDSGVSKQLKDLRIQPAQLFGRPIAVVFTIRARAHHGRARIDFGATER